MKIYVVTHKNVNIKLPKNYSLFQVNAVNSQVFCKENDAIGDNISKKNPYYCELTAVYWIWKNDIENDVIGIAHYRRYLTKSRFFNTPIKAVNSNTTEKYLKNYDIILPRPIKFNITVREQLTESVYEKDLLALSDIISCDYPDYINAYESVLNGYQTYYCNIMICGKPLWNAYCEWLFPILAKLEKRVDMTGYDVSHQRLYGYLSERLLTVYVRKHGLKVKTLRMFLSGIPFLKRLKNKIISTLVHK